MAEIDAADAIEYVEQFMQAQGAYNPAAIAALAYARKALAENVSVRAALAGAEQATTDALRARLADHYLANIVCDHERSLDNPICACSRVNLGWHPSVGAAVAAWIDHVMGALAADVPSAADHTTACEARSALERIANEIPKLDGLDDERLTKGLEWIHQVATGALTGQCTHGHYYLSTACNPVHDLHEPECGAAQRARGDNSHPHCKFCDSPCVCPCHTGGQVERAERVHADGCTLAADDPHHAGWCVLAVADDPAAGEAEVAEHRCPACGSTSWVSVSLDEGWTRRAQCVPCGRVHAPLGPGWRQELVNGPVFNATGSVAQDQEVQTP